MLVSVCVWHTKTIVKSCTLGIECSIDILSVYSAHKGATTFCNDEDIMKKSQVTLLLVVQQK